MELDDNALIKAFRNGDRDAFGALYDRYLDRIYRFIYYKTFSPEVTTDLTSDVFHKAYTKINTFNETRGTFSAWLYRIARNSVIDHYRTARTSVPLEDVFDLGEHDPGQAANDVLLTMNHVRVYLDKLTPRQREILMLRVWEEKSYAEIAEIIGGTEGSAKMAFSRVMKELREKCGHLTPLVLAMIAIQSMLPFDTVS
jgi:RNA polymerase sigma-70 factor (ECF subfamily)